MLDFGTTGDAASVSTSLLCLRQIFIRRPPRLPMRDERMDTRHAPGMLRGPRTMSRSPGRHTPIVDRAKGLRRDLRAASNLRDRLRGRADLTEARGIRRATCLHTDVRLEGCIRTGTPPGHARPTGCVTFALSVLSCREPPKILLGPVHCFPVR